MNVKQLSFLPAFKVANILRTFCVMSCLGLVVVPKTFITLTFRKVGKFAVRQWELWAVLS